MILFSFSAYENTARQLQTIASVRAGRFTVRRFENQELYACVEGSVSGEHCVILGTIAPPDECLLSVTLLAQTLKKEGADQVTVLLPYLAYSRQDKDKSGESLGTAWVGALLKSSRIDQVLTVDVHSERDKQLFPISLISLSTANLFADVIRKHGLTDATIVAPDNGAIGRCEAVKRAAGMPIGVTPYFEKKRTEKGIIHDGPVGTVGARVVIVDDMIDTGGTLVSACEKLRAAGVQEIYILVTHGLFTGSFWLKLWSLGVRRIFCTDTVPLRSGIDAANITILSAARLITERLSCLDKESRRMAAPGQ
ncbi:MAG: ribose-phosphate diphosphokinase [Candidatus Acidiferrales bacterium]